MSAAIAEERVDGSRPRGGAGVRHQHARVADDRHEARRPGRHGLAQRGAGLGQVGVLLSASYTTLRAGYWVVYSGVLTSEAAAERLAPSAAARGFAGAYPAHVVP